MKKKTDKIQIDITPSTEGVFRSQGSMPTKTLKCNRIHNHFVERLSFSVTEKIIDEKFRKSLAFFVDIC